MKSIGDFWETRPERKAGEFNLKSIGDFWETRPEKKAGELNLQTSVIGWGLHSDVQVLHTTLCLG